MALHDDDAACFIFEEVPGTIKGSRMLVNFFGGKRKNMTLGFPTDLNKIELSEGFRTHFMGPMKRIPPRYVNDGPIFENVIKGEDVDLTAFPAPQWHEPDGGRYIGTGCFNVMRDPDDGWINCGTYRVMIHDAKSAGFYISPGKHGRQMRDKYQARGERMPVAVVCGGDPMSFLMACSEVPSGVSEYEIVGGMRGKPVDVIKGPLTGLPIPANAEIVLEGFVEPGNERIEGPVRRMDRLLCQRRAARAGARHQGHLPPQQPDPARLLAAAPARRDLPLPRGGALGPRCARTSRRRACPASPRPGRTRSAMRGCCSRSPSTSAIRAMPGRPATSPPCAMSGAYCGRYTIVVDDDIDVSNLEEVVWALLTRSDPATSIDIIRNAWSTPLDPRIEPERKEAGDYTNSRAIIDACRPFHWRDKFPAVNLPSPERRREALQRFGHLFKA